MAQAQTLKVSTWPSEATLTLLIYKPLKFNLLQYRFSAGDMLVLTGPTTDGGHRLAKCVCTVYPPQSGPPRRHRGA